MYNSEPVYRIDVPDPTPTEKVGAVLVFQTTDVERIQRFLDKCAKQGIIEPTQAQKYTSHYGEGPVFYIP